jgi:predicted AlkP superfamily phosphohydrolase/phosphomutase
VSRNETDSGGETKPATTSTNAQPSGVAVETPAERKEREARERGATEGAAHEQAREVGATGAQAASLAVGGRGRPRRLLLGCLDGATPELAIGAWRTQLRTIHMLTDRGSRGRLRSSIPWSSTPAWLALLSGQEPGRLGVYARRVRPNHSDAPPAAVTSRDIAEPRRWDMLGAAGKHVGVLGGPATTPPPPVRGHLVGEHAADGPIATHPPELAQQVALWLDDDSSRAPARGDELDQAIGQIYARSERRFRLARRMLARDTYDCFVLFDDGIAAVQRLLWHALDVTHPRHIAGHPFADTISAFYRFVDEQVGELLELIDDDTIVALVSACGAQSLDGELALNDWLIAQGDLALVRPPFGPAPIERCEVDWPTTRAWAGDNGAIYLNVAGREPQGTVAPGAVEQAIADLRERLRALGLPGAPPGKPAPVEVYRPSVLYGAARGVAPDLLVVSPQPGWRPSNVVGYGRPWVSAREAAIEAATESPSGFVAIYDPHHPQEGRELGEATIYDIVPTLLALLGEPVAPRLRGRVLPEFTR